MLGKTQETTFYKLDWAQRENEMCPEAMKKVGTDVPQFIFWRSNNTTD